MADIIDKLKNKAFRDAYVNAHLTQGLAYQIKALRMQRGWSQQELANRLGLRGQSAIARIEDPSYGKLSIATLLKLSSIFDIALSVKFKSFGKFIHDLEDVSFAALSAESFDCELPKLIEKIENAEHSKVRKIYYSDSQLMDFETKLTKPIDVMDKEIKQSYLY